MKENVAKEKLRVIDIIRENAALIVSVGGFVWLIFQFLIIPVREMQFQMSDVLNNHIKTIQDQMVIATAEREMQSKQLALLSEQIVRLTTLIENK
jgi:hypothetical protein